MVKTSSSPIQSLDRGLVLLTALADAGKPLPLPELCGILPINRSSVFRLMKTLEHRGFVSQARDSKAFNLGPTVWRLANQMRRSNRLLQVARSYIEELASRTGETAHLAVRQKQHVVFMDHELTQQAVGVSIGSGRIEPLHCTALGKALLVNHDESQLRDMFGQNKLKAFTDRTITTINALAAECAYVRVLGYASDDQEYRAQVRCLASPIYDFDDRVVAAIGISAPSQRLAKSNCPKVGQQVNAAAQGICAALGYLKNENKTVI